MTWTWLGIAAAGILILACAWGFHQGFVRELVSTFFMIVSIVIVWAVNPYVNDFIKENTAIYEKIQGNVQDLIEEKAGGIQGMDRGEQSEMIDGLELPEVLKNGILENNTAEVYAQLAVNTFTEYVADYLTSLIVNALSFAVSFLLVTILVRVAVWALNILTMLPVVHGANKLAGALIGGVKCVVFIWIALLLFTVFCSTEFGQRGMELVEKDWLLSLLYEYNIFIRIFTHIP